MGRVVLTDSGVFEFPDGDGLWLSAAEAARATGWTLKPEGMCRDDVCVPMPAEAVSGETVDLAAFWTRIGAPLVQDDAATVWSLAPAAGDRLATLASLEAPDFELPDLAGTPHRLADLRGNKVLLVTWASW
jgi:hypothetical protein